MKIKNKYKATILLLSSVLLISACDELDELLDKTSIMYAEFEVVAEPEYGFSTVFAKVRTKNSSGSLIQLSPSDAFWSTSNGDKKQLGLPNTILTPDPEYSVVFGNNALGNTEFSISLIRESETDAPNSKATLPDPFFVDLPYKDSTLARGSDITFMWTPGQSNWLMEVRTIIYCHVDGKRISEETVFEFDDSKGIGILTPEQHSPPSVLGTSADCSFHLIFSRINSGTIDSNFHGGYFNAIQRRNVYITTTAN